MNELTLEALAKRIEAIEKQLPPRKDWLRVVGISEGTTSLRARCFSKSKQTVTLNVKPLRRRIPNDTP